MRISVFLICLLFLVPCVAFGDVIGIAVFSEPGLQASDELASCVLGSLKDTKGHYIKAVTSAQPFNLTVFEKICRSERIDVIYHFHFFLKENRPFLELTQYHLVLKKVTGREVRPLDDSTRFCDAAVFAMLDHLDKEPTFKTRAEPVVHQARALAGQGRYDEAGSYYTQAGRILPNAGSIYREMGLFLESGGLPYWAMEWYRLAIGVDRHEVESHLRMASILRQLYTSEEAANYLQQIPDLGAKPPVFYLRLGELYEELGNLEPAWQYYEKAIALDPSNPDTLLRLKRTLSADKQWSKAAVYQLRYLKSHPNDTAARTELLETYLMAENFNEAIAILQEYIRISPNEPAWISRLGRAYLGLQELEKAREQYLRLLQLDPGNGSAYLALGKIDYQQQRFSEAKGNLQHALADYSADLEALRMLGQILEWEKNYTAAIENQKKIILYEDEMKDADLLALFALGRKADQIPQVEAAINDLIRFKSRADSRKLVMALAGAMVEDGRKEQAVRFLQSKLHLLSQHGPAYLMLGNLLVEQGRYDEADRIFMSAVFSTADASVPLKVAMLYHKMKRFDQAEYFYRLAAGQGENSTKVLLQYLEVTLINSHLDQALWAIYDVKDRELPPLYQMWLSYLQIMWAGLKGDAAYFQSSYQYAFVLMDRHGPPARLDFEDFKPVIQSRFQGRQQSMLMDLTLLFEGKLSRQEFQKRYTGQ